MWLLRQTEAFMIIMNAKKELTVHGFHVNYFLNETKMMFVCLFFFFFYGNDTMGKSLIPELKNFKPVAFLKCT